MKPKTKKAFTIVELLTVISIITIIIGLLVPALNKARDIARDTKQRAQFHAIEVAIELFKTEQDDYPESTKSLTTGGAPRPSDVTCGAHKLAEALIGRDLQGLEPGTSWDAADDEGKDTDNNYLLYYSGNDEQDLDTSLDRRKGPYLEQENMGAFGIQQIYQDAKNVYPGNRDFAGAVVSGNMPAPVITDVYNVTKVNIQTSSGTVRSVNSGMPILYYKASTSTNTFQWNSAQDCWNSIYNIYDNDDLVALGQVKSQDQDHKIWAGYTETGDTGPNIFYTMITNPKIVGSMDRPYRPESYILISAGKDNIYGTADDITNFGN